MKTIIMYCITGAAVIACACFSVRIVRLNAQIDAQQTTIARQEGLIKELAQQEAIAIHITNEFKSNAVLGKVQVDANIKNVAEQCAAILKGELNGIETPIKRSKNGH